MQNTTNYGLNKPENNDNVDITKINDNMDIIDTKIKESIDKANEAFQSASNGKTIISNAITGVDSSVTIPDNPTFAQLATAIGTISTGKKYAIGTASVTLDSSNNKIISVRGLTFKPALILAKYKYEPAKNAYSGFSIYADLSIIPGALGVVQSNVLGGATGAKNAYFTLYDNGFDIGTSDYYDVGSSYIWFALE